MLATTFRLAIPILVLCNIRPSSLQLGILLLDKDRFRLVLIEINSPFHLVFCLTIWYNDVWISHQYKNRGDLLCSFGGKNPWFSCCRFFLPEYLLQLSAGEWNFRKLFMILRASYFYKENLASVSQNRVLSHFQFTQHFLHHLLWKVTWRPIRRRIEKHLSS